MSSPQPSERPVVSKWSVFVIGAGLAVTLAMGVGTQGQQTISEDDLFGGNAPTDSSASAEEASSPSESPATVAKPRLVREVPDFKYLYEDRTRKAVFGFKQYSDDSRVLHGNYVEFYRDGREFCRGQYQDGKREGEWTFRHPDGSLAKKGTYDADRPVGQWEYFWSDGRKIRDEQYKDGLPHGMWVVYDTDGKTPLHTYQYENGKNVTKEAS